MGWSESIQPPRSSACGTRRGEKRHHPGDTALHEQRAGLQLGAERFQPDITFNLIKDRPISALKNRLDLSSSQAKGHAIGSLGPCRTPRTASVPVGERPMAVRPQLVTRRGNPPTGWC